MQNEPIIRIHWRYILTHRDDIEPRYDFTMIQSYPQEDEQVHTLASQLTGIDRGDYTWDWTIGDGGPYRCFCQFCTIQ